MAGKSSEKVPQTSPRKTRKFWMYACAFAFMFGMTAAELGLVSDLLHEGGNSDTNYPSKEYKHDLGLLLFTCIVSLLYIIAHSFISMGMNIFLNFALAVFWGTGAGVLFHVSPFESYTCDRPASDFSPKWAAYADHCARVVAMQGLAWALWVLCIIMMFGMLFHLVEFKTRNNVSMYRV
ncbi:hypothetical protein BT96DRAFT_931949 [Gymnopus androsaceus JB14]|uniref:MARVEL domain-containing protein n=1 Tax=Gymnopus androsaceus JB14 TaxID=1447944 RepID=A0A6A4IIV3_9AGAR|nr:hypothetical protein BT96DRAFT_931949 [Gymnopus androsaceus JB14]